MCLPDNGYEEEEETYCQLHIVGLAQTVSKLYKDGVGSSSLSVLLDGFGRYLERSMYRLGNINIDVHVRNVYLGADGVLDFFLETSEPEDLLKTLVVRNVRTGLPVTTPEVTVLAPGYAEVAVSAALSEKLAEEEGLPSNIFTARLIAYDPERYSSGRPSVVPLEQEQSAEEVMASLQAERALDRVPAN